MNGILIVAHAPLASALRQCALHVYPECADRLSSVDVLPQSTPEENLFATASALDRLLAQSDIDATLVLADLAGATPCQTARRAVVGRKAQLLTGVNLPMVLSAVNYRYEALDAMLARARSGAMRGIDPDSWPPLSEAGTRTP